MEARLRLAVLLGGFAVSQMLYVAARLNLADHLHRGPMSIDDLAVECSAKPEPLRRVVRALAAFGVFRIDEDGEVSNTALSEYLRMQTRGSLHDLAITYGEEQYTAMGELYEAVKRGGSAFERVYRKPLFTYLTHNPDAANAFYGAQNAMAAQAAEGVVDVYDFSEAGTVVEVAGGRGHLIRAVLRLNPLARGVLFDSGGAVRKARAAIRGDGLEERCEVLSGDLFESVPGGGDVYLLHDVIQEWDDDRDIRILRNCRRAMHAQSRLLVIEHVAPDKPTPSGVHQRTAVSDAVRLAISGGRARTLDEHSRLLEESGFQVLDMRTTALGDGVIEAVRP